MRTVLLHGFWGEPRDWNAVLARLPLGANVWAPDLHAEGPLTEAPDLNAWTTAFLDALTRESSEPVQLVGYSMGGRLALQALTRAPERFRRALICSATPFLHANETAADRAAWEQVWRERFLSASWDELERQWSDQPVFTASAPPPPRRRQDRLRHALAHAVSEWSVRHHTFGVKEIRALPPSVEWAFGALDQKYQRLAKSLQELPVRGQITSVAEAGHRLVVEAPDWIAQWISRGE